MAREIRLGNVYIGDRPIEDLTAEERKAFDARCAELMISPPGPTGIVFCGISTRYTEEPPYEIVCNTYTNMDGTATAYTARHNTETDAWEMLVGPGRFDGRGEKL